MEKLPLVELILGELQIVDKENKGRGISPILKIIYFL